MVVLAAYLSPFGGRCFDSGVSLFLRLPSSPFRGYCGFGLRFLRPGRLPGGGHYRLLRSPRDRLRRGIRMWVGEWSRVLDNTPPSDDVVPPFTEVHLLGRGTGTLGFRSGRFACDDAFSAVCVRLLCKSCRRFLPLHTAMIVRCVVFPVATGLRVFPRGRASHNRRIGVCIRSYAACGRSAYIVAVHLELRTTPPTLVNRCVRLVIIPYTSQAIAPLI